MPLSQATAALSTFTTTGSVLPAGPAPSGREGAGSCPRPPRGIVALLRPLPHPREAPCRPPPPPGWARGAGELLTPPGSRLAAWHFAKKGRRQTSAALEKKGGLSSLPLLLRMGRIRSCGGSRCGFVCGVGAGGVQQAGLVDQEADTRRPLGRRLGHVASSRLHEPVKVFQIQVVGQSEIRFPVELGGRPRRLQAHARPWISALYGRDTASA